jgi:lipid A 3-O-deacylase
VGGPQASGWHVFVDLSAAYVARDLLLDGNTRGESHSVAREPVVTRVAAGLEYRGPRFQVTFARERRSREFVGQRETNEYGALGFSIGR